MPCWDMARKGEIAALEARRFAAARLFARGAAQAVVVARFGVSRQTAHHWDQTWKPDGRERLTAGGSAASTGPSATGPDRHGVAGRTACARVQDGPVDPAAHRRAHRAAHGGLG